MRLDPKDGATIRQEAVALFGEGTRVYLFGSRTDDSKRGGDIDLYIEPVAKESLYDKEIQLRVKLKMALGDQRIDIVMAQDPKRSIEQTAKETGVLL